MITWLTVENFLSFRVGFTHSTLKIWAICSGVFAGVFVVAFFRMEFDRVWHRFLYEPPTIAEEVQYHVDQLSEDDDPYMPELARDMERPPELLEEYEHE
jgi:hypothetical protein